MRGSIAKGSFSFNFHKHDAQNDIYLRSEILGLPKHSVDGFGLCFGQKSRTGALEFRFQKSN